MGAGVAVVAAGGGAAWALTGDDGPSYRLATVTRSTVTQTVTTTGTIAAVNSARLRFPVSGTVEDVDVAVGDHVSAGQTVASLDTTELEQQLQAAQAAAAAARQTLANDTAAQASGDSSGDSADSSADGSASTDSASATRLEVAPTGDKPSGPSTAQLVTAVRQAQQKLLDDQHAADLDADVVVADQAVLAENDACTALLTPTESSTTPAPAATDSSSATPTDSSSDPTADDLQKCQDAITAVQQAQHKVQDDIHTLTADEKSLDDAVSALLAALRSSSDSGGNGGNGGNSGGGNNGGGGNNQGGNGSSGGSTGSNGSNGGSKNGSNGSNGGVITAAQLAADQRKVDAADAQVTLARQSLAQATLTATITGTVAAVAIAPGDAVSAGSSTQTITVIGPGQESVSTTIGINDVDLVKKGQSARVTVDGVSTPFTGTVTRIGLLNTSGTSGSTTTYPVTIVLNSLKPEQQLFDGAGASVSIAVGSASNVLTVPTSALHGSGVATTVQLYRNGKPQTQRVTVGTRGLDSVAITSGLTEGEQVVLAEVSAPVPSSDNQNGRFGRGGLGGFGGAGGGPVVIRGGGGGK